LRLEGRIGIRGLEKDFGLDGKAMGRSSLAWRVTGVRVECGVNGGQGMAELTMGLISQGYPIEKRGSIPLSRQNSVLLLTLLEVTVR
jgi:hypothetical protein